MTSRDLLGVMLRRWYLVLLGAAVSVAVLAFAIRQPGVYYSQFEVVVLPPVENVVNPNNLEDPPYSLTAMAGLLVTELNDGKRPLQMGSSHTTLYGEGLRRGSRVRLRNEGSQWQPIYKNPVIDVQVVDSDEGRVARVSQRLTAELSDILDSRQDELDIEASSRMTTTASPEDPVIYHVGGSRSRAALAIAALGATTTALAVFWLDHWLVRRRRSKTQTAGAAARAEPDSRVLASRS